MKGGDILDFWKGGTLRKGRVDLEKGGGGMTPHTNYGYCWPKLLSGKATFMVFNFGFRL